MERIKQHPHESLARQALCWIVYATRPLEVEEVQHAIAIDDLEPEDRSIAEESLTPQAFIVNATAGLIKVDEESNIIGLVHKTTQEYFDRKGAEHFPDAQLDIGMKCLKYLSLVFSDGPCLTDVQYENRLMENALLDYAAQNVGHHIRDQTGRRLQKRALKFLMNTRNVSCASQVLFVSKYPRYSGYSQANILGIFLGIHYACLLRVSGNNQLLDREPSWRWTWTRRMSMVGHTTGMGCLEWPRRRRSSSCSRLRPRSIWKTITDGGRYRQPPTPVTRR